MQIVPQILSRFTILSTKTRHFERKFVSGRGRAPGLATSRYPCPGRRGITSSHPNPHPQPSLQICPAFPRIPARCTPMSKPRQRIRG